MEFLTDSLNEVLLKLSENKKEEIDVIESIVFTNKENKENTKEKVFHFVEKRKPENCIIFILGCINHATIVRPKERESLLFLLTSIFNNFHLNYEIANYFITLICMLQVKNIIPSDNHTENHIFDFADEGTIGRSIFDDSIDSLQQLLAIWSEEYCKQSFSLNRFLPANFFLKRDCVNRIELAALFGSIKCFKFLMMSGDEINESTCVYAVAGGNNEIIHLCEQKGLVFDDCLLIASVFHRFEIFEWLNIHFNYEVIQLSSFIKCYNEPLFYFYFSSGLNVETRDEDGYTPINLASSKGQLEIVKHLYGTCRVNVETKDDEGHTSINNASRNGQLEVVKYLHEICNANVETRDEYGGTPINNASRNGHIEVVKYLHEICNANVETRDEYGCSPINNASRNGQLKVVKYLHETCNANVEIKDIYGCTSINNASLNGQIEVVKYLYEVCHANVESKDLYGYTPIKNASKNGHHEVVKYLNEIFQDNFEIKT